jgi:hypothetical protein
MGGGKEIENRLNKTFKSGDGARWRRHIRAAKNPVGSEDIGYINPGLPEREPSSGARPAWSSPGMGYVVPVCGIGLFVRLGDVSSHADFAVIDTQVEPAIGAIADPGLIVNRRAIAPVVGQRKQDTRIALQTLCKLIFHPYPPIHLVCGSSRNGLQ